MSINKIKNICSDLVREYDAFSSKIDKFIISEAVAKTLFADVEAKTRSHLTEIFGDENVTRSTGLIGEVLKYDNVRKPTFNPFCDAVIFAYWSHRGDFSKYLAENHGYWRDNLFYKGNRWSNNALKDAFYLFFRLIENATGGNTPVKFFTRVGMQNNKPVFCILYGKDKLTAIPSVSLPSAEDLKRLDIKKLNDFLDIIGEYRAIALNRYPNLDINECKTYIKDHKLTEQSLKNLLDDIYKELITNKRETVVKWRESIVAVMGEIRDGDEEEQFKQIIYQDTIKMRAGG